MLADPEQPKVKMATPASAKSQSTPWLTLLHPYALTLPHHPSTYLLDLSKVAAPLLSRWLRMPSPALPKQRSQGMPIRKLQMDKQMTRYRQVKDLGDLIQPHALRRCQLKWDTAMPLEYGPSAEGALPKCFLVPLLLLLQIKDNLARADR
jgi:hypothetical protein